MDHHRRSRQRRNDDRPVTGGPHTYHTTNPVPFILAAKTAAAAAPGGALRDIAPTLLGMLGVPEPAEMTGRDLRVPHK